ncbi:MAG: hypothetical protein JST36_09905 [Bacteroidetes bacterium]|nr:hypothetical protein [Bacteroidota bacterium]
MKKIVFSLLLFVTTGISANACDVCGCSASNQYLGILPKANFNFIGLQYQFSHYSSDHPSMFENHPNEQGKDYYHTLQVWGRYNIGSRVQVFAFVPYRYNVQEENGQRTTNSGLSDLSLLANVLLLKETDEAASWQHQLLAGGGIKLPTGKYSGISSADKQGLPNMQPGTGSVDFLVNTNYTLRKEAIGLNVDAAYTITLPNRDQYKYGNRANAGAMGFYSIKKGEFTLLPQAGVRFEYALHDYDNYERKWLNEQSGGYMCFAAAGLQAYYKQIGLRVNYQLPISQYYGAGYVTALQKVDAGIFFLF